MNLKVIILSLCMALSVLAVRAESKFTPSKNKHDFRVSFSDGIPLILSNTSADALSGELLGIERTDEKIIGVFGLGYRYRINRFRVGSDLAFALKKGKLTPIGQSAPAIEENQLHFIFLPTAEFIYFKRRLVELYGSGAIGMDLYRNSEKALTREGQELASKSTSRFGAFIYQLNPIAVRVGNDRIGGFVEAGLGLKGFVTAGVSIGF